MSATKAKQPKEYIAFSESERIAGTCSAESIGRLSTESYKDSSFDKAKLSEYYYHAQDESGAIIAVTEEHQGLDRAMRASGFKAVGKYSGSEHTTCTVWLNITRKALTAAEKRKLEKLMDKQMEDDNNNW